MRNVKTADILTKLKSVDDRIVDHAFTFLYREYFPVIQSFIRNNNGSEEDAADIFQDALIVLYDKARDEQFELRCTLKTFIYSICKNLWLKRLSGKKQILKQPESFDTVSLEPNISSILEDDEHAHLIAQLLRQMGPDNERLMIYFYFDGLKTEEVTHKMGFANEQVTRNKKSKCLKKLRELLKESTFLKDLLF